MANHPHNTLSPQLERPLPTGPRYEIVFEGSARKGRTLAKVLRALKALSERSGSVVGDAYALAAGAVLNRTERLEDLNAERRYRQRSSSTGAGKPGLTSRPQQPSRPKVKP
jgi:hypothetical protein